MLLSKVQYKQGAICIHNLPYKMQARQCLSNLCVYDRAIHRSTLGMIMHFYNQNDKSRTNTNPKTNPGNLYIDLSKAFDTLTFDILLF